MKYVVGAYVQHFDDGHTTATADVVIDDHQLPRSTGLVDAGGRPIYRVEDRVPMGFQRRGSR